MYDFYVYIANYAEFIVNSSDNLILNGTDLMVEMFTSVLAFYCSLNPLIYIGYSKCK